MGSTVTKNNKLAGWIDDFVNAFANKESNERTAEININDLPKVVWNDETFYVFFEKEGASIINGFKNTVTTLPNIKTMEEVNKELNGKQIVSEFDGEAIEINAEIENEINKALASTILADEADDEKAENYVNSDQNADTNQPVVTTPAAPAASAAPGESNPVQASTHMAQGLEAYTTTLIQPDYIAKSAELMNDKLAEFETKISEMLDKKISSVIEQIYARINPGNIYDLETDIQQQEIDKFTEEAVGTENQILMENEIDRTTPEGKYTVIDINDENVENANGEVELPEDEVEIFKEGSCPVCGSQLAKTGVNDNFINIKCDGCDVEYKVNTDNEKIYLK